MNKVKSVLVIVAVLALAALPGAFIRHQMRAEAEQIATPPATMSQEQYLALAVEGCMRDGASRASCECAYGTLLDEYGVAEVTKIDTAAQEGELDERLFAVAEKCRE